MVKIYNTAETAEEGTGLAAVEAQLKGLTRKSIYGDHVFLIGRELTQQHNQLTREAIIANRGDAVSQRCNSCSAHLPSLLS